MASILNPSYRERAKRYRKYAADALKRAVTSMEPERSSFAKMAENWTYLAEAIEADLTNFGDKDSDLEEVSAEPRKGN